MLYPRRIDGISPNSRTGSGRVRVVSMVAVRHSPISALGARGGAFCMSIGVPMCGWLAKGRCEDGRDSAALRLRHLEAARGGPGNPFGIMQPSVLRTSWQFPPPSPGRKQASAGAGQQKQPAACAAGCMVPKGLRRGRDLAERFELYQFVLNRVDL